MLLRQIFKALCFIALNGTLAHIIGEAVPRERIRYDAFPYRCAGWEQDGRVYRRIAIEKWKDVVPDMSRILRDMYPKHFSSAPSAEQVLRLIQETCVAETVHIILLLLSPVLAMWVGGGLGVFFMILNILGNLPFALIQRYNRPRLCRIYRRMCKTATNHPLEENHHESVDPDLQYRRRT